MDAFEAEVARVRDSGVLGRSHGLARLFDYLAGQALAGRPVREADIAADVFGREVDLSGDASVRVYVHRLRKKLDAFYGDEPRRLTIPLGEYRLELAEATAPAAARRPRRIPRWWIAAAALLLANAAALGFIAWRAAPSAELAALARAPLWAGLGRERPVLVVVGDYYIFGEADLGGHEPRRMIREFDINSAADLDAFLMANPALQGRYIDLDTTYTPVGATLALREILPIVRQAAGRGEPVRVTTASQLRPEMLRSHDIVYVGYLSGLGLLQAPVLSRSRYQVGETFDELTDRRTGAQYVSGAGAAHAGRPNRDYGYVAAFEGPAGNRIVVVAGLRDIGVMQMGEVVADRAALRGLEPPADALFEVEGVGRANLSAKPVS